MQMSLPLSWQSLPPAKLTAEQRYVFEQIEAGCRHHRYITVGGYAGTGKSVLLAALAQAHPDWLVCTPSWQSASVLQIKGLEATTVHSLVYKDPSMVVDGRGRTQLEFHRKSRLEMRHFGGLLVDEAGMVGRKEHEALLALKVPLVYFGDHGQLPPVSGDLDLMADPMYRLETMHRSASEISRFSLWLREGHPASEFDFQPNSCVRLVNRYQAAGVAAQVSQIGCSYNATRVAINRYVRKQLGRGEQLEVGDRITVLSNNKRFKVFNGMTGVVKAIDWVKGWVTMEAEYFGPRSFEADFSTLEAIQPRQRESYHDVAIVYAYARTAYSLQGAEFETVLAKEEDPEGRWSAARNNYTLATRAKRLLYWQPLLSA